MVAGSSEGKPRRPCKAELTCREYVWSKVWMNICRKQFLMHAQYIMDGADQGVFSIIRWRSPAPVARQKSKLTPVRFFWNFNLPEMARCCGTNTLKRPNTCLQSWGWYRLFFYHLPALTSSLLVLSSPCCIAQVVPICPSNSFNE